MKIVFLTVGKKHSPDLVEAIQDYTDRLGHYSSVEWKFIEPSEKVEVEAQRILDFLNTDDYVVLLDEKGTEISSVKLAEFFEKRLNDSTKKIVFIIGGAFGVHESVRQRANKVFSLSQLTFPHQLVRLILSEQVYRAFTILRGEKYHHV